MAPSRFKRSRRPSSGRKTRKNRAPAKKVSKAVKSYVKRAIHSNIENKLWNRFAANETISTAAASNPEYINLVPYPSQSTTSTQYTRIGNRIRVMKAYIKGFVNLKPYNSITNPYVGPVYVKMWLCRYKELNCADIALTSISTNFFEGVAGSTSFQGNMLDMSLTNNKDDWIIYKTKTFELGTTSNDITLAQVQSRIASDNSRMTKPFYFSFGKHLRKQLQYDVNGNPPTNTNLFLVTQVVYADGSAAAIEPAEYHYTIRAEFEDA